MQEAATESGSRRPSLLGVIAVAGGALVLGVLMVMSLGHHGPEQGPHHEPPPFWGLGVTPFVALLGCIAILPLLPATHHWWETNVNKLGVSLGLAAITLLYYVAARGLESVPAVLEHAVIAEYVPFIVLLFSLYVISGGISVAGDLQARPAVNTAFLAVGAAIASLVGTTGASMLLIRPLIQTNAERRHVTHTVIFFVFLVSNIGGCLLPIGDPPLFLGYLSGVPFFWTLRLWGPWLAACGVLLVVYYCFDRYAYAREEPSDIARDVAERRPLRLRGWPNLAWLAGVVGTVAFVVPGQELPGLGFEVFPFLREVLMLGFVALSLATTSAAVRKANSFSYAAIVEVAALFIGIFITMQVAIEYLKTRGSGLGVDTPWEYFWATGSLSSFLDNAPTYLVFFEAARSLPPDPTSVSVALAGGGVISEPLLVAISLGSVFMGSMTYIGNGPNFMVKSIAEQAGVPMPSFFGYMFRYSIPILIPVFVGITLLFILGG